MDQSNHRIDRLNVKRIGTFHLKLYNRGGQSGSQQRCIEINHHRPAIIDVVTAAKSETTSNPMVVTITLKLTSWSERRVSNGMFPPL